MAPKDAQAPAARTPQPAGDSHVTRPSTTPRAEKTAPAPTTAAAAPVPTPTPSGELILPLGVVSRSDISKSLREVTELDDFFHQASVRGSKDQSLPAVSRALDSLATENGLNLLQAQDRARIKQFLTRLKAKAPVVHMSFPSEASGPFLAKILEWFRREAHPHTVLHIGLQPELAAGCLVRTTNKAYDFSFRKRFEQSKQKLVAALEAAGKQDTAELATQPAAAAPTPVTEQPAPAAPAEGGTA